MPESTDAGSRSSQSHQEQDRIFQPEHDGGFGIGSGMFLDIDHLCLAIANAAFSNQKLNKKLDKNDDNHLLRLKDTFVHKHHLCLAFELLSINLYELIKQNQFHGLSTALVRVFAQQLLDGLSLLNRARLIHCDLKPENILLKG